MTPEAKPGVSHLKGIPGAGEARGVGVGGACVGTRTCTFTCLEWARGPWNSSDAWMFGARTGGHLTGGRTGTPKGGRPRRQVLGEGLGVAAAHGVGRPGLRPRLSPASWGVAVSPGQQQEAVPSSPPRTSARAHRARTVQGKGRAAGTRKLSVFASYPPAAWASQPFSGALATCRRRILLPSSALRIAISTLAHVTHPCTPPCPTPCPAFLGCPLLVARFSLSICQHCPRPGHLDLVAIFQRGEEMESEVAGARGDFPDGLCPVGWLRAAGGRRGPSAPGWRVAGVTRRAVAEPTV